MKSEGAYRLIRDHLPVLRALFTSREAARAFGFPWFKMALGILAAGWKKSLQLARMANAYTPIQKSLIAGDTKKGVLLLGQVTGIVTDTPTVSELINRLVEEAAIANKSAREMLTG